jgi:hypothetical protein
MNRHQSPRLSQPVSAKTGCEQSQQTLLSDDLVGAGERRRNFQSERLRYADVDHQLELRRPLDREVA